MRRFANNFHEWRSHEWKSLANRITGDHKIVIHGNECIILFLTCYLMSWTLNSAKTQPSIADFAVVALNTHSQYKCKFGMGNFRKIKMLRLFSKYFLLASWVVVLKLKYCHITNDRHCVVLPWVCISWLENMSCVMYVIVSIHTTKVKYLSFDTFVTIAVKYTNSSSHSEWWQYLRYLAHSNYIDYDLNTFFSKLMKK